MPTVYLDLDGCVADFFSALGKFNSLEGFERDHSIDSGQDGKGWVKVTGEDWKRLQKNWPTFWVDLDLMPHGLALWRVVQPYGPSILSAIPPGWQSAGVGKKLWVKQHLPKFGYSPKQEVIICKREDKAKYAKTNGVPNILIDDQQRNISDWVSAGGIGIYYSDSLSNVEMVRRKLKSLL